MKYCPSCGKTKSDKAFAKNRSRKNGLSSHCKACHSDRYYKLDAETNKRYQLKRYYGITFEEYEGIYQDQNGDCAICGKSVTLLGTRNVKDGAHVDHDHATGSIRGLLCHNCNAGIGYLRDSTDLMSRAIDYLDKGKEK